MEDWEAQKKLMLEGHSSEGDKAQLGEMSFWVQDYRQLRYGPRGGMILPKKEEKSAGRSTEALRKTGIPGKSSGRF